MVDRPILSAHCEAVATWQEASRQVRLGGELVKGRGDALVENPATAVVRSSADIIRAMASELGLTPAARARFNIEEPDESDGILS